MNKQPIVCLTGFTDDPMLPQYISMLAKIKCKYIKELLMGVDYLIVRNTCTQKYKIAELEKSQAQCLTIDWLKDSFAKGRQLPIDKYKVPHIFYGVRIGVYGLSDSDASKLIPLLRNNGAELAINININSATSLKKLSQQPPKTPKPQASNVQLTTSLLQSLDVIISTPRQLLKLMDGLPHVPVVTIQWVEQSLLAKQCKYPLDYSLNWISLRSPPTSSDYKRLNKKYKSLMENDFIMQTRSNSNNVGSSSTLLSAQEDSNLIAHCIIYLQAGSISQQIINILKKLISLTGGIYVDVNNLCVSHVLVGNITDNQYTNFMKHGDQVHVLRVQWLIDSLLFSQKMPERDYKVRSFKGMETTSLLLSTQNPLNEQHSVGHGQFSQTYYQYGRNQSSMGAANTLPLGFSDRKSMKNVTTPREVIPKVVKKHASKTEIFKGKYFYLDKKQRKDELSMKNMVQKISENGGTPLEVLPPTNKTIFVVLADSEDNPSILQELTHHGGHIDLVPMSTRWIEHCIKRGQFLTPKVAVDNNFFIFKPFSFMTPVKQLMAMKIEILGINDILKIRYRELLSSLGSCKVSPNKSQITHCLCGKDYRNSTRYKQLIKENPNIKFVRAEWLICLSNDKTTKIDNFLLEEAAEAIKENVHNL